MIDNAEAYFTLSWILDDADKGFYIVVATPRMQRHIATLYSTQRVAIYDYSQIQGNYSYALLNTWMDSQPEDVDIFFFLNMQIAFPDENYIASFNMSRDWIAKRKKICIFFMDKDLEYQLSTSAYDIYAYVRQKMFFESELEEEFEGQQLLEFDNRHNIYQIQKALEQYKPLEEKYMSLSLEDTPSKQLLAAAIALFKIAELYRDCEKYNDALRLLYKIQEIREYVLGEEHPNTIFTYSAIAMMYSRLGDYIKALELYQHTLNISKKVLGEGHPHIATIYNNIASVCYNQGDYSKALELYQQALAIHEKMLSKEDSRIAITYSNIADVYSEQGDYNKALELYQQALAIHEKALGKEHPDTITTYNNIAYVHSNMGEYQKALDLYNKTLAISEKVLGKDHPNIPLTYNNMAFVYERQGNYKKALKFFQKAYDILLPSLGKDHPNTKIVEENIRNIITETNI